jgi:hypothetical protein
VSTTTADVNAYAAQVRAALADLPAGRREDLLADLEEHLAEVAEESDGPLESRLGAPAAYAAELRAAAGLPAPPAVAAVPPRPNPVRRGLTGTLAFLPELLPAWAIARPAAGNLGVLLLALVTVPASVLLGRLTRRDPGLRWLGYAASTVSLVLVVVVAGVTTMSVTSGDVTAVSPDPAPDQPAGLDAVTNLYPYSSDGRPLTGVQLYDQDGNPVNLQLDIDRDGAVITRIPRRTTDGQDVTNVYPQQQVATTTDVDGSTTQREVTPPTVRAPKIPAR